MLGRDRMGIRPDAADRAWTACSMGGNKPKHLRDRLTEGAPMTTATDPRAHFRRPLDFAPSGAEAFRAAPAQREAAPIVVAIDNSRAATAAVQAAVSLGADLAAPLVFVYVRQARRPHSESRTTSAASTRRWRRGARHSPMRSRSRRKPACRRPANSSPGTRRDVSSSSPGCAPHGWSCSARGNDACAASVARGVIRTADRPVLVAGRTAPPA